jgi:glycosyltransferase involved in cell wall biosynthesis
MKRLMIVNVHYAPHAYGGATVVAENMARELSRRHGWKVLVVTGFFDSAIAPYSLKRYAVDGIDVIGVCIPKRDLGFAETYANAGFDAALLDIAGSFRPDVVHVHSVQTMGASFIDGLARRGMPVAVTLHDAWWWCERQFMVTGKGHYCHQTQIDAAVCSHCVDRPEQTARRNEVLRPLLAKAGLFLFPSTFFRGLGIANGLPAERCHTNRNGVTFPGPGYNRRPPPPGTRLRFGFVGGPGSNKGALQVLGALRSLARRDYELTIVDAAQNNATSWRGDFDWAVPGKLRFHPAYTMASIDQFFETIDVLLFPSQWKESFGLTVREAMARHVWVVASDGGGLSEDCAEGVNASLIPMTADHRPLAAAITHLLDHHDAANFRNPLADAITTIAAQGAELDGLLTRLGRGRLS